MNGVFSQSNIEFLPGKPAKSWGDKQVWKPAGLNP